MSNHLRIHSSNYDTVQNFLNSDKVLFDYSIYLFYQIHLYLQVTLLVCSSHVDPQIGSHRKVLLYMYIQLIHWSVDLNIDNRTTTRSASGFFCV